MENKNANEPAFAFDQERQTDYGDKYKEAHFGLTKREYFAAMAMQGILASGSGVKTLVNTNSKAPENVALSATKYADELLKQLEKQ